MQWAVGSGLMKGKSGNLLDSQGTATRAEIAAMLHRFIEKYELVQGKAPGGLMGWIDPKRLQIPKTGDSSVLGLWGFSLCISLAGCLALTTWQIRRWREEEALQIIEKETGSPFGARAHSLLFGFIRQERRLFLLSLCSTFFRKKGLVSK